MRVELGFTKVFNGNFSESKPTVAPEASELPQTSETFSEELDAFSQELNAFQQNYDVVSIGSSRSSEDSEEVWRDLTPTTSEPETRNNIVTVITKRSRRLVSGRHIRRKLAFKRTLAYIHEKSIQPIFHHHSHRKGHDPHHSHETSQNKPTEEDLSWKPDEATIIIGLDFGTTFSLISYGYFLRGEQYHGPQLHREIREANRWPGGVLCSDKVPTKISRYQIETSKYSCWGNGNPHSRDEKLTDLRTYEWIKLLLEPDLDKKQKTVAQAARSNALGRTARLLEKYDETAVDVSAEYIKLLWENAQEFILKDLSRASFENAKKKVVMTFPALWSDKAKENTYHAAMKAGLCENNLEFSMVSEPEAAAYSVLYQQKDLGQTYNVGDTFIICDCGGGTVDIITYQIESLTPLSIKECIAGKGGPYGAENITMQFEGYLKTAILGEQQFDNLCANEPDRVKLWMNSFDLFNKKPYGGDGGVPPPIHLGDVEYDEDDLEHVMENGALRLTDVTMRYWFEPLCREIEQMVRDQAVEAKQKTGRTTKMIHLVGGFAESPFLYKHMRKAFEAGDEKITVRQPANPSKAISHGAIYSSIYGKTIKLRIARRSYGVLTKERYNPRLHSSPEDILAKVPDMGVMWVQGRMCWLLSKGENLHESSAVQYFGCEDYTEQEIKKFNRQFVKTYVLYGNDDDKPTRPNRIGDGVYKVCTIKARMDGHKLRDQLLKQKPILFHDTSEKFYAMTLYLEIRFGGARLEFRCLDKDKAVFGQADVEFF